MAMKNGAQFHEELIGIFMFMVFMIIGIVELFLCRQLSKIIQSQTAAAQTPEMAIDFREPDRREPAELRGPQARALTEPVPSVTENTTRTLNYSRNEPTR